MSDLSSLLSRGYTILEEINQLHRGSSVLQLGKFFLNARDRRDLEQFEQFVEVFDPLLHIRNTFSEWEAQCDLALANYKRTVQVRSFEKHKNAMGRILERRKPDYSLTATKMKQAILSLDVVQKTAIPVKPAEAQIPAGATEVITVERGKPFTALKQIEGIFERTQGYLLDK